MIECLPSYLRRLASCHECSMDVFAGLLCAEPKAHKAMGVALRSDRGGLLCPSATSDLVVRGLEAQITDLDFRTMLNPRIGPHVMLSRSVREKTAWCPDCFREWREEGRALYLPLLWQLTTTTACPKHQRRLSTRCFACGSGFRFSGKNGWTSYCSGCGFDHLKEPCISETQPNAVDLAMSTKTEALLRWSIPLQADFESRFVENITRLGQVLRAQYKIAARLGLDHKTVMGWTDKSVPSLGNLIRIAAVWDVEPRDLLVGEPAWGDGVGRTDIRFEPQRLATVDDRLKQVACLFEKEIARPAGQRLVSLAKLCKAGGTTLSTVKRHRPDLAATMVERAKEFRVSAISLAKTAALNRCREVIQRMQRENRPVSRYYVWRELEAMGEPHLRQVLSQFPAVIREMWKI